MSTWKHATLFALIFSLLLPVFYLSTEAQTEWNAPSVSAQASVLIEADSGAVVCGKEANQRLPMASTTKIMTALTALSIASPDTEITVDAAAVGIEGSSIYLSENEVLSLKDLLYALLLESANDAAAAIAIGLSGSIEAFADEMNRVAKELSLKDTHFVNPHGLDHEEHYTTAYELALIARAALQNPVIREIVSTKKATIPHDAGGARLLINHNKLLRMYDGCIGMKTGFTKHSGRCLVSAAERDGVVLIAVTLNAPNDWKDHSNLLDYGFSQYKSVLLCESDAVLCELPIVGGNKEYIPLYIANELRVTLPVRCQSITQAVECAHFEYAPIAGGQILGRVVFRADTDGDNIPEEIASAPLLAGTQVERTEAKRGFWQWLLSILGIRR